ncbi:DNA-methyltransferase [Deinococcus soli (ex Cha et al. 2016)]|uniref:DNA-methyltransferase n=1 Tax=Deinococcus soli (ex Cha et al. 2016) TaxID=1309411 RepID=UPI0019A84E4C|nr:site-specific DNA-methyltransferase [Deinococcus soli (ex Cha et al. 2016)]GGB84975.1 methyltransferase [Deinococcus soli (ex Cha et al. 2016)]
MLHLGNCIDLMRTLPDQSIDALISDPPYGTTALKFDQAKIDWEAWWREVERITKPTTPIVLFAQQPFTTDLIVSNRKMFRYLLVWQKTMPTGFLDANARPLRAHEDILVFAHRGTVGSNKNRPTYNPQKVAGEMRKKTRQAVRADHYSDTPRIPEGTYNDRHPTSVIQFSNHNGVVYGDTTDYIAHPTAKPVDLMRWLVATYSNPGDVVLDPFTGSGTTGVACVQLGREFIGMELDATYHALASQRIAETQPDAVVIPEPPSEGLFASD